MNMLHGSKPTKPPAKSAPTPHYTHHFEQQTPHFPSALHQAARDHASEAIKSYNSRNWKKRWSKQPTMSIAKTMRLDKRTVSLRGNLLSFSTIGKE